MGFDEHGNGYGEHEGLHDLVHRPLKFPLVDASYEAYMKAKLIQASLDDIRAIVREEVRSALAEKAGD